MKSDAVKQAWRDSFHMFQTFDPENYERISCNECGYSEATSPTDFKDHMVNVHSYRRVGGQVFKRCYCHCGKPGLYRVGSDYFCRIHKDHAIDMVKRAHVNYKEPKQTMISDMRYSRDATDLRNRSLHRTKSPHK